MGGQAVWQVNVNFKTLPKVLSSGTDRPQRYYMVPDHSNKANIAIKQVIPFFWFLSAYKVTFTLYCNVLTVQQYYV